MEGEKTYECMEVFLWVTFLEAERLSLRVWVLRLCIKDKPKIFPLKNIPKIYFSYNEFKM